MCAYIYMCVCINVYVYIYVSICIDAHIATDIHTYICVCINVYTYIHMCVHTYMCPHRHIHIHTRIYTVHTYIHLCINLTALTTSRRPCVYVDALILRILRGRKMTDSVAKKTFPPLQQRRHRWDICMKTFNRHRISIDAC